MKVVVFISFSASRYGGLAKSSQPLLAAHLVGVGDLIQFCRSRKIDEWYLKGYYDLVTNYDCWCVLQL